MAFPFTDLRFYALLTASFREIAPTAELTSHPKSAEYSGTKEGGFLISFREGWFRRVSTRLMGIERLLIH